MVTDHDPGDEDDNEEREAEALAQFHRWVGVLMAPWSAHPGVPMYTVVRYGEPMCKPTSPRWVGEDLPTCYNPETP